MDVQELIDRAEIQQVLLVYCRGVDRRNWKLAQAAFFDDATDHHGDFKGSIKDFFDWIIPIHQQAAKSTHFAGNCLIEFASPTVAVVETYFAASLELGPEATGHRSMFATDGQSGPPGRVKTDVLGRYIDRFEKRGGEWRVARRQVAFDQSHTRPVNGNVDDHPNWVLGRRDETDAIFLARTAAGLGN